MDISKIKKAPYNPRRMGKASKEALKKSLETFEDISGITVNKRSGNVVAGNHRWDEVTRKFGGINNMEMVHLNGEYYSLNNSNGEATGFLVRVVDWDDAKEKAANVAANSDLISGEFTSGLQDVLNDVVVDLDELIFDELRLDELMIDLDGVDEDLEWGEEKLDKIQTDAEKKNRELDDAKGEESSEAKEVVSSIKISGPSEIMGEVKDDLLEFLAKKDYYGEIIIL